MIAFIIIVSLALAWLARETDYFTIRLSAGVVAKSSKDRTTGFEPLNAGLSPALATTPIDKTVPYWWQPPDAKEKNLILCNNHTHYDCPYKSKCRKSERWLGWKLSARVVKAWGSTMNFNEGCNIARAELLRAVAYSNKRKLTVYTDFAPLPTFIKQVRIGSHHEYIKWNHETQEFDYSTKPKKGYCHRVTEDYTTKYHDCLPGKDWLKEHEHDTLPEPLIELSVDGGKSVPLNGNFKKGAIKEFVKANK